MCPKLLQLTLAIIKPHVIKQPHALQHIKSMIIASNFKIVCSKQQLLSVNEAAKFYEEHKNKFFYNRLVSFMTSGPSEFYILCKENAIKDWRELMGPTKVYKAIWSHPNTIRGLYGLSDTRNAAHGSDSPETAKREINLFFPEFNIYEWYRNDEKMFRLDKIAFINHNFIHIPIKNK